MSWMKDVEIAKSIDDLMTSRSIQGRRDFPDFEMLDAKRASGLQKITSNPHFRRRVSVEEQRAQKHDRFNEEGRLVPWSMTTFEHPMLMMQHKACQIFSISTYTMWTFNSRFRHKMGSSALTCK